MNIFASYKHFTVCPCDPMDCMAGKLRYLSMSAASRKAAPTGLGEAYITCMCWYFSIEWK